MEGSRGAAEFAEKEGTENYTRRHDGTKIPRKHRDVSHQRNKGSEEGSIPSQLAAPQGASAHSGSLRGSFFRWFEAFAGLRLGEKSVKLQA
jgi:hypothetical protein